jgi:hypothetical protein
MRHTFLRIHEERRSKPFLLLHIGVLHVRLYAVDAGRGPIRITMLKEESLAPGDTLLLFETVKKVLDTPATIRELAIVLNSPGIHHQILCLPPLNAAERQKILPREMRNSSAPRDQPTMTSCWSAGKVREPEALKEYVLCAELPKSFAEAIITAASDNKFTLIGFTSQAQMASLILKDAKQPEGNNNVALLEVNEREGSITLFRSNIWNMDRQFTMGASSALADFESAAGLDAEKLKLELGRAIQYFKQQVRSENIHHIFLFGNTSRAIEIQKVLESSFPIPVTPLFRDKNVFADSESAGNQAESSRLYGIPHAIALHARFETYIDFLPAEWRRQKQTKIRHWALGIAAMGIYLLLGGVAYLFHCEASKISAQEQPRIPPHADSAHPILNLEADRSFALATELSDEWLRGKHHILANLARELAGAAPSQMRIAGLEAEEKKYAWHVKLTAEIRSPNGSRSQQIFLAFQEQMRRLSCLKQLAWDEIRLTDFNSNNHLDEIGSQAYNVLTFAMQGTLNYPTLSSNP